MTTPKNLYQEIFEICMSLNVPKQRKPEKLEEHLATTLPKKLHSIESKWEVAWGPAVFEDEESPLPGSSWFVASHGAMQFPDGKTCPLHVVAIGSAAGFEKIIFPESSIGLVVNLDEWASSGMEGLKNAPHPIKNEPSTLSSSAHIANGFGQTLFHIINEVRGGEPAALISFLRQAWVDFHEARFVFTGHGLGGALAPSLAYTLVKAGVFGKNPTDRISVYPIAGQSPGNLAFAESFRACFPSPAGPLDGYQHWNVNVVNPLDIVPCGYCMDGTYTSSILASIPTMYGVPAIEGVQGVVEALEKNANRLYYPLNSSVFDSPVPKPKTTPETGTEYLEAAWRQHIDAYKTYILGKPQVKSDDIIDVKDLLGYPLLGDIAALQP